MLFFDKTHPTKDVWFYRVGKPEGYKNFSKTKPLLLEHLQPAMDWWSSREEISDADGNPKAKRYSAQEIIDGGYNLDLCGFPQASTEVLSPAETIANYKTRRAELDAQIDAQIALIESLLAVKE